MKVTSNGRVTIPISIRKEFGLKPGTEVQFIKEDGKVILQRKRKPNNLADDWLREATGIARQKVTTTHIMKLTRDDDRAGYQLVFSNLKIQRIRSA